MRLMSASPRGRAGTMSASKSVRHIQSQQFCQRPSTSVYENRRGREKGTKLLAANRYSQARLSTVFSNVAPGTTMSHLAVQV